VTGKGAHIDKAVRILLEEGYLTSRPDPTGHPRFVFERAYFEGAELLSDQGVVPSSQGRPGVVPDEGQTGVVPLVPSPPFRGTGGDDPGGVSAGEKPKGSSRAVEPVEDRACGRCFRPVPSNVLQALGGVCGGCRAKAGEVGA